MIAALQNIQPQQMHFPVLIPDNPKELLKSETTQSLLKIISNILRIQINILKMKKNKDIPAPFHRCYNLQQYD